MRWHILSIGKPKLSFAAAGIADYAGRLNPFAQIKSETLKAGTRETESAALLERSAGMFRIVLDERGDHITSRALAAKIDTWEQRSVKNVAVIIGGADGHTEELRRSADWLWSLSKLTFQHELALLVTLEQLYRAYTIKAGLPYHRD
ncbi:MAG: Ribosomal large subunit methyltransferase [Chthoniobacteraceae bacterium]|nr:Ribosomal large subunit methyltransferase [Chthoniobacteraceae bacterium]